ncbi:SDR family oxidoreductase [Acuticoccus sp. MNP-M23]|uniref:SDR family NAD(P)-dependent oxidoreductase n=1 Tax=Acuticoccus sp. MNP-M23 TaxID=3072793 RepID=UPI00281651B0|nr:SDR family oxidoreductase [Acuticoccus sp. MNP-M23]WMS44772.1 SDR family oxidoreductase [Acuticoccus sp. MNP-M23]
MSEEPIAILTGASSGIGEALAHEIAADGYRLVLVARRVDRLEALAARLAAPCEIIGADLTDPADMDRLKARLAEIGEPAVLVNNAGLGQSGPFAEGDVDRSLTVIDLNIRALVSLTRHVLPGMLARGRGGILNVASTAAFQPGPNASIYYASKAFVLSFSEALTEECAGKGVTVTALCPGPTETEFFETAGMDNVALRKLTKAMPADQVARTGWAAFKRGKRVIIPGVQNKTTAFFSRLIPHRLLLPVVKRLQSGK